MKSVCWWCVHACNDVCLSLPISYDFKKQEYSTVGTFCSWECLKAYNYNEKDSQRFTRASYICMMKRHLCGKIDHINTAPPRQALKIFGGNLDITEFRTTTLYTQTPQKMLHNNVDNLSKTINYKWVSKKDANINYSDVSSKNIKHEQMKIKKNKKPETLKNNSLENSLNIFPIFNNSIKQ